ncbi:MFS transporter [Xenorhabdus sp. PB30.3]|uniref:MFS transporter n=1 Tax=Xenorhabdus sp. PB30.3 TaxID=2788941 RepID=UPI001E305E71|nr:MFS transporter [Xenorhabdus sp. PB30.3]MCC8378170.1 MFS transporter [Xenorhabdus sp. PB30.3]
MDSMNNVSTTENGQGSSEREIDSYSWKALLGSAVGYAMDGFDLLILGFMLHTISADLNLTPTQSGSLITWTLIGAVVGGVIFGALSDRFGRVRILTWTIVLFAVFTGLCAFARGYWELLIYRTIAGVGLGGEFGIGMTLAAESWPARHRSRVSSYVAMGWQTGVLLAALLTPLLLPVIGWRGMFIVGIIPAFIAWFIRHRLHEPDVFVYHNIVHKPSILESFRLLVKDKVTAKISLGIIVLTSVQNLGYYGIIIWMPSYLAKQLGFNLTTSAIWTTVTILGMMAGIWIFGQIADRIGRKPSFILFQMGAAVSIVFYSQLTVPITMLWAGALLGIFVNGMLGGYGALISEAYPTAARATAQNVLFNIGRGIGGFGPILIGTIATFYSFHLAITLLASIYIMDIIATIYLIPELKGNELN